MILIQILKDHLLIIVDQTLSILKDFPFEPLKFHKYYFAGLIGLEVNEGISLPFLTKSTNILSAEISLLFKGLTITHLKKMHRSASLMAI